MLKQGAGFIRQNVRELMKDVESEKRHKAIMTLAKKHNISYEDAQYRQSLRIAEALARKKA